MSWQIWNSRSGRPPPLRTPLVVAPTRKGGRSGDHLEGCRASVPTRPVRRRCGQGTGWTLEQTPGVANTLPRAERTPTFVFASVSEGCRDRGVGREGAFGRGVRGRDDRARDRRGWTPVCDASGGDGDLHRRERGGRTEEGRIGHDVGTRHDHFHRRHGSSAHP